MGDTMSEIIVQIPPHCNPLESASARVAGNMFFGFLTIGGGGGTRPQRAWHGGMPAVAKAMAGSLARPYSIILACQPKPAEAFHKGGRRLVPPTRIERATQSLGNTVSHNKINDLLTLCIAKCITFPVSNLVPPTGFEPATNSLGNCSSIQLRYGGNQFLL